MRKSILLVLLFNCFFAPAQKIQKNYYENGKLNTIINMNTGLTKNFGDNGKLFCIGKQEIGKGRYVGEWKYYGSFGFLSKIVNYKEGKANGEYKSYQDGKLYALGQYKDNKETGKWKYYYRSGELKEFGNRENNNRIGKWKELYKNGQLMCLREYDNDGKLIKTEYYKSTSHNIVYK